MTTIILTIIGILLAAAAAIMVLYYGGASAQQGRLTASANTLINVGENIINAEIGHYNQVGAPAQGVNDLVESRYLADANLQVERGTLEERFQQLADAEGKQHQVFLVRNVPNDICLQVERKLRRDDSVSTVPAHVSRVMGCVQQNGKTHFYTRVNRGSSVAPAAPPAPVMPAQNSTPAEKGAYIASFMADYEAAGRAWKAAGGQGTPSNSALISGGYLKSPVPNWWGVTTAEYTRFWYTSPDGSGRAPYAIVKFPDASGAGINLFGGVAEVQAFCAAVSSGSGGKYRCDNSYNLHIRGASYL